eukprot:TRINITY_DN8365_c0_g1_i1.p1 TRINITY_DN8365_c0_g1~~TRINITY_DN8365_c0_g1_i1.p1  ORF type:complete len:256 (+),score=39.39 TRINITY_DN8365_c0_g1_i1:54-821(+)
MSTVYKTYVSDFKEAIGEARKKIQEAQVVDGEQKKIALVDAEKSRRDAEQLIKQMQLAARNGGAQGPQMLQEIDQFRTEVSNLQRDLQALTDKYKRAALLGGTDEEAITSLEDRQKMRTDTQRLANATGQLAGAVDVAQGALNTGVTTLEELAKQRERLENARTGLSDIRGLIRDSTRIIKAMWNSNYAEAAIKLAICVVLIILICVISSVRWGRGGGSHAPAMPPTVIRPPKAAPTPFFLELPPTDYPPISNDR